MKVRIRRSLFAVTVGFALIAVSSASGVDIDGYTAAGTPAHVKPSTQTSFTVTLTNKPASPSAADKAKIAIPAGFTVAAASVQASASAAGDCVASTWVADGTLIDGGKINLKRPGGSANNRLCPGATLTVQFLSTSPVAEGTYVWATELFRGADTFALTGPQPSVAVDGTAPTVTISSKPANPSNDTSPTFEFSANEPAGFECKLDGAAFAPCTSPATYAAGAGPHSFALKATDAAGNSAQTSYDWIVDTVAPITTLTQKPGNPSNVRSPSFSFSANEAATFECRLDTDPFASCSSSTSYSDLPDGVHTFTVKTTDAAGNSGETSYAWKIDTVAPSVTFTQKPNDPNGVNSATFAFSVAEPATFQCRLDTPAFTACTSPKTYLALSDGAHTFAVRATDAAGNIGVENSYSWLVETVLPVVTLTDSPKNPSSSRDASFSFTANKAGVTLECQLDRSDDVYAPCVTPQTQNYVGLADGVHTFRVRATGAAGTGPPTVYVWTIDTTGPTTAITDKPAHPTNSRSASFAFAASEPATFECKLDGGAFAACSSPQSYGNLGDGGHAFVVRAVDALSNVGPETAYAWTIETRAPLTTIVSAPRALGNSTIATFTFSADEPATFQCKLDDRVFEACTSPATYAGLRDGGHAFVVRAIDSAGNTGVASRGWTVDATAPQTKIVSAPARSTRATSARFAFSSSEPATFQCRLDRGAFAACGAPKRYKGLARGLHTFAVRAIDPAGNVDATAAVSTWTIGSQTTRTVAQYALFAPALGARVTRPPLLRWRPVSGAKYYNVQLYRGSRKVLSAWPARSRLQLRTRWTYGGRVEHFKAGVYRWYVWPGLGPAANRRYGRLLGSSTFVVGRATRRG